MKKSRFSEEQMVKILREADKSPVSRVAKKHGCQRADDLRLAQAFRDARGGRCEALRPHRPCHPRRSPQARPGRRVGSRLRLYRRPQSPGLRGGTSGGECGLRDSVLPAGLALVRKPRHTLRASSDRQCQVLRLERIHGLVRRKGREPALHPALHAPDQRKGRAVHPDPQAPLGLSLQLQDLGHQGGVATTLGQARQSPATPPSDRQDAAHGSAQSIPSMLC